jgi:hypothetical protein
MPMISLMATDQKVNTNEFSTARWKKPSLARRM